MNIRPATLEDAGHFVRVFELASYGLAPYFWQQTAGEGGDPQKVAMKSMRNKLANAAPNTALVIEVDGEVAGGIITYDIGGTPEEMPADCDPVIVPLIELENRALNTHYVNALAVFPEFQGRGLGTTLLRRVEANAGTEGLSLVVEDQNIQARNLYEREKYMASFSVPIFRGGWDTTAKAYILMKRKAV